MIARRSLLIAAPGLAVATTAYADSPKSWTSGANYTEIKRRIATQSKAGRVEVIEFLWYGCQGCYALEPHIVIWSQGKPSYVDFVRVPVTWHENRVAHSRLFHALRLLGRSDLDSQVFDSIHRQQKRLETLAEQIAFVQDHGIDAVRFETVFRSDSVDAALKRADVLSRSYRIEGVPSVAVNGKYTANVKQAGSEAALISLVNFLAKQERRSGQE